MWDQVEIPISNDLRFHTVFCCPVSKEESAPGNPPVLLKCGHAICKACVKRISFNMTRYARVCCAYTYSSTTRAADARPVRMYVCLISYDRRFKCPTCPAEMTESETRELFF